LPVEGTAGVSLMHAKYAPPILLAILPFDSTRMLACAGASNRRSGMGWCEPGAPPSCSLEATSISCGEDMRDASSACRAIRAEEGSGPPLWVMEERADSGLGEEYGLTLRCGGDRDGVRTSRVIGYSALERSAPGVKLCSALAGVTAGDWCLRVCAGGVSTVNVIALDGFPRMSAVICSAAQGTRAISLSTLGEALDGEICRRCMDDRIAR